MNSQERKPKFPKESFGAGKSLFTPQHGASTSRDIVEKPFPCKPVYLKRLVKSTSHDLELEKKSVTKKLQDVPIDTSLDKDSSRQIARELQMTKAIQEKQLLLQKKLWNLEDAIREKTDDVGVHVYKGNQTTEKAHYGRKQEVVNPESKTKQKTEMRSSEMLTEKQNPQQYKFRQDTIPQKSQQRAKWDKMPAGETLTKKKEVSKAKYVNSEQTESQEKALVTGNRDTAAGKTVEEKLVLPQVELESTDKNIQLLPCIICKRNFLHDRLEKHIQICEKVKTAKRPVFNSVLHRTKGSALEEFLKTHTRSKTPEVLRKKRQSKH